MKLFLVIAVIYFLICLYGKFHYLLPWHEEVNVK